MMITWLGMLSLAFLSACLAGFQSWMFLSGDKPESVVPDLVGMPYEQAALSVEQVELVLRIRSEAYDDKIEANRIMDQTPAPGARVKVGREVWVDVSLGSRTLSTPNVIGRLKDEAIADLEEMGVNYRITVQDSDLAAEGTVINQRPAPGSPIAVGEIVDLVVASRPLNRIVDMPHLENLPYPEALQLIAERRLVVREVRRVYHPGTTETRVFAQFPLAGTRVMEGSDVILTLSCPPSMESQGQRSIRVSVTVPQSAGTVRVRIVTQDRYQTKEAYSAEHTGPATIEQLITTYGRTTVKVYFDNRIIREESF